MNDNWLTEIMFQPEVKEALNLSSQEKRDTQVFAPLNHRKICMLVLKEHISSSIFWIPLLDMIECEARRKGYAFQMYVVDEGSMDFLEDNADGYLFVGNILLTIYEMVEKLKRPIVWAFNNNKNVSTDQVCVNNRYGTYMMAQRAIQMGHRHLGYLNSSCDKFVLDFEERYQGVMLCAQDYAEQGVQCEYLNLNGPELLTDMLMRKDRPTFIQTSCDTLALELIRIAKQLMIRIPDDLSVAGFDNIQASHLSNPPLATMSTSLLDIAISAVQLLDKRIQMPVTAHELIQVQPVLLERESLAPPCSASSGKKSVVADERRKQK